MARRSPVEFTARYATNVDTLPDAWQFVMEHIEKVGPDPSIEISPVWTLSVGLDINERRDDPPRHFSVVVCGMVEQKEGRGDLRSV